MMVTRTPHGLYFPKWITGADTRELHMFEHLLQPNETIRVETFIERIIERHPDDMVVKKLATKWGVHV